MTRHLSTLVFLFSITLSNLLLAGSLDRPINPANPDVRAIQAAIVHATNAQRRQYGLPALLENRALADASQMHAIDMVRGNFFSHDNPRDFSKRTPSQRAEMMGLNNPMVSENIATSFGVQYRAGTPIYQVGGRPADVHGNPIPAHTPTTLAQALVSQWMDSPGHRRNILAQNIRYMGAGVAMYQGDLIPRVKAVQMFMPATSTPSHSDQLRHHSDDQFNNHQWTDHQTDESPFANDKKPNRLKDVFENLKDRFSNNRVDDQSPFGNRFEDSFEFETPSRVMEDLNQNRPVHTLKHRIRDFFGN